MIAIFFYLYLESFSKPSASFALCRFDMGIMDLRGHTGLGMGHLDFGLCEALVLCARDCCDSITRGILSRTDVQNEGVLTNQACRLRVHY